jgi:biopolymer transport protein ExbB/TolQ
MGNFTKFVTENLSHVLPIIIAGIFAAAIVAERIKAVFYTYPLAGRVKFYHRIRELVMADKVQDAISLCDQYPTKPSAQVVKEGLLRAHLPEQMVNDGLNIVVGEWIEQISKRTAFLSMIANVATLLGLFGTIAGLIQSFEAVGSANPQEKSALLAAGISTAMNATMMGLGVAIPSMVAFSFIMNRTNRMVGELDQCTLETLDIIRQRSYGVETKRVA